MVSSETVELVRLLFIDARKLGRMVDRTHRELTDEEIARIADTYHARIWRGEEAGNVKWRPFMIRRLRRHSRLLQGSRRNLEELRKHGHVLTPGRYVGVEAPEDDGEPFEQKMRKPGWSQSWKFSVPICRVP